MVKFSKEYEAQLIPEWKHAFMCYKLLKKHVKKIKSSMKPMHVVHHDTNCNFGPFVFEYPIRALWRKITGSEASCNDHKNHDIIQQVKSKISTGEGGEEVREVYETELGQLFSEEYEVKMFFEMLDNELNKVNQFYKNKETEFLERGEILNKQLQILIDLKRVLNEHHHRNLNGSVGPMPRSNSSLGCSNSDFSDQIQSMCCGSPIDSQTDDVIATPENNGSNNLAKTKNGKSKMAMRIDIPATTPTQAIAAVTSKIWEDLLKSPKKNGGREYINRKKIQCAEKMIRGAYVELYKGLALLKTYSSLNMMAFTKILKKFDKVNAKIIINGGTSLETEESSQYIPVANQHASESYLKVVKRSNFITSDKVVRLKDVVDSLFTQQFANNDRKKAMKFLRPQQHKNSHMVTFFWGLFTGSFLSLFSVYGILTHLRGMFSGINDVPYMETMYHVFSIFALLSLHLFVYGCNLFMWKTTRINCNFIFEFQPSTALNYRDAFLICTCLMTAVVGAMMLHLLILLSNGFSAKRVNLIPGILLLCFAMILTCPLNIFYRPTRYHFLRLLSNTVCSPFYKVLFVDVFMGDQLTSQTTLLKHIESAACHFLDRITFETHGQTCRSRKLYRELVYIVSIAPYYWRALQCGRRWFDEGDRDHLVNMGKYVSTMVAVGARVAYARDPSILWLIIVLATSLVATIYLMYWDFVKDWGLLDPKSKNRWLRDDLMLKNKAIYYVSIALNFVLRVTWVETVLNLNTGFFESRRIKFLLASLEIIRRGQWNFYRLENEHLSNVGKFRAVRAVSLPFQDRDSDGVV